MNIQNIYIASLIVLIIVNIIIMILFNTLDNMKFIIPISFIVGLVLYIVMPAIYLIQSKKIKLLNNIYIKIFLNIYVLSLASIALSAGLYADNNDLKYIIVINSIISGILTFIGIILSIFIQKSKVESVLIL